MKDIQDFGNSLNIIFSTLDSSVSTKLKVKGIEIPGMIPTAKCMLELCL